MSRDVAGSIRKFTIEGISFRVMADANFSRKPTNVENTMVPTSGVAMQKKVRMIPVLESVVLAVNAEEMETIKSFAEGLDLVKVMYETAAGDQYRAEGQIEIEAHESEENRANVTVQPAGDWTLFPA
jgi:hypothetical protein